MDLQKARLTITANVAAQALYMKTIDDAKVVIEEQIRPLLNTDTDND